MDETFALDLQGIAERMGTNVRTAAQALKVLELNGDLALSDGFRIPRASTSSVLPVRSISCKATASIRSAPGGGPEDLRWRVRTTDRDRGGTSCPHDRMVHGGGPPDLEGVAEAGILEYRPPVPVPAATLLTPRRDAATLMPDPAVMRDREGRALERMDRMRSYFERGDVCRRRRLAYFGAQPPEACGQCDVRGPCQDRPSRPNPSSTSSA